MLHHPVASCNVPTATPTPKLKFAFHRGWERLSSLCFLKVICMQIIAFIPCVLCALLKEMKTQPMIWEHCHGRDSAARVHGSPGRNSRMPPTQLYLQGGTTEADLKRSGLPSQHKYQKWSASKIKNLWAIILRYGLSFGYSPVCQDITVGVIVRALACEGVNSCLCSRPVHVWQRD